MARLFDSFIMVDWSAASKPASGKDSIWIGALAPDARLRLKFRAANPETREKAFQQLKELIQRLVGRGDRILLGFDFPLGYPKGTAAALGLKSKDAAWVAMHEFLCKEMKDKPDNTNNRFALAARMNRLISDGPFPFWGCPKRDELTTLSVKKPRDHEKGDVAEYRLTEKEAIKQKLGRPQPVWKVAYAGAVGGQSLTGIPVLHKLQAEIEGFKIWPFEMPLAPMTRDDLDGVNVVATEIYPSMRPTVVGDREIRDEAQVRIIAEFFAELDEKQRLGALFEGPKDASKTKISTVSGEEGWILGV